MRELAGRFQRKPLFRDAVGERSVSLQVADKNVIEVSIHKVDKGSAIIARDAEYYFSVEQQLAKFLAATKPNATTDTKTREFRSAVYDANHGLEGGQMRLRYRIIAVSGLLPPAERSQFGRYRLHLRPLFRLHVPRLAGKEQPTTTYRSEWHLNTWDFSPDQVVPGKTILEFTGSAAFNDTHHAVPHMTLRFPGADSNLITFALEGGVQLVYTPSVP